MFQDLVKSKKVLTKKVFKKKAPSLRRGVRAIAAALLAFIIAVSVSYIPAGNVDAARDIFSIELSSTGSKSDGISDVEMEITNNDKDFTGIARLLVRSKSSNNYIGYDVNISIPKGSTKTYTVSVPINDIDTVSVVNVVILDRSEKNVYSEKFSGTLKAVSDYINVGVLADNTDDLSALDLGGKKISATSTSYTSSNGDYGSVNLTFLTKDDIIHNLASLDILLINNYDTSTLGDTITDKLLEWTRGGGALIFGLGENAVKTVSGFDEADINFSVDKDSVYEESFGDNDGNVELVWVAAPNYSGNYYSSDYMAENEYFGSGNITVFEADFADAKLISEMYQLTIIADIYKTALNNKNINSYNYSSDVSAYDLENVQGYMEKPARTGGGLITFLIIIYVILIGPVAYLILKAMNKREKIWLVIPGLSLIFVLFIFLISIGISVKGITLKSVSIQSVDGGRASTYVIGYNPNTEPWTVKTMSKYITGYALSDHYTSNSALNPSGCINNQDDYNLMTYYPDSTFDTGCFVMYSDANPQGSFDIEWDYTEKEFRDDYDYDYDYEYDGDYYESNTYTVESGKVTNKTGKDFDYAFIYSESGYQLVEDFSDGETVNIDFDQVTNSYSGYLGSYGSALSVYGRDAYEDKDYEKSGAISAICLAAQDIKSRTSGVRVIGVEKTHSVTDEEDKAWKCYYGYE